MIEVTRGNFSENYDQIMSDLDSATFISIDCEYSGLFSDKPSLFDTPAERYKKIRHNLLIKNYHIIQIGFTTFRYNRNENNIISSTYSFYLMPGSVFQARQEFSSQTNSLEFLCKSNFNFNKLFYDGLNYVSESEEKSFLQVLNKENYSVWGGEENIKQYCLQVAEWEARAGEGSECLLDTSQEKDYLIYLLHLIIRKKFINVWTFCDDSRSIKVKVVNKSERAELLQNKEEEENLKVKLHQSVLGFANIMKQIKNLKKPLVGHNFFLDLLIMYNQFYGPLPVSYKKFKQEITKVFPQVYDTKHMSYHLRNLLQRSNKWTSNSLRDLFAYFSQGKGSTIALCTPLIQPKDKDFLNSKTFHDAGFDSFCTGFCFVKMAHIYSIWDKKNNSFFANPLPMTGSSLLKSVDLFKNYVNFPRSQVNFIALDGPDFVIVKPCFLLIKGKQNQKLDELKIVDEVAKFSSVDVMLQNQYTAILAVRNNKQADEIVSHFKDSNEFCVTTYNFVRFKYLEKGMILCGGFLAAALGFVLYKWLLRN